MNGKINLNSSIRIEYSGTISEQLMVCSHERSGTHFAMNTIDTVSDYCSNPWLNYDLIPLGARVNFFDTRSTSAFIKELSEIRINGSSACNSSILKSHFPLSHLGSDASELPLKIIYIWRDPAETIASLWQYMHNWEWNEGPKTESPIQLATARPSGQSQRYQTSNYKDYFERWAAHVMDGIANCEKNPKAQCVSCKQLLTAHTQTTKDICERLGIKILQEPQLPDRHKNVIKTKNRSLDVEMMKELRDLCYNRIEEFPVLKARLEKDQERY